MIRWSNPMIWRSNPFLGQFLEHYNGLDKRLIRSPDLTLYQFFRPLGNLSTSSIVVV